MWILLKNKPWPTYPFVISEIVSVGLAIGTSFVNYGIKYIWIPLTIAWLLAVAFYCNAIYCCREKDKYFDDYKNNKNTSDRIENISNRIGLLESRIDGLNKEGGIKSHN